MLKIVLPLILSTATFTSVVQADDKPAAFLGTDFDDSRMAMPFSLIRNESISIHVQVEKNVVGDALACRLLLGERVIESTSGTQCDLHVEGQGTRYYVLQVLNIDQLHTHAVYITAIRGRTHQRS